MALKKIVWKRGGMHMVMESGHKTFDRQTNCISTGNVIANTELGWFIRPSTDLECNGHDFVTGALQAYDLKDFERLGLSIGYLRRHVEKLVDQHDGGILYAFFHLNGEHVIVHGLVLTDKVGHHMWHHIFSRGRKSWLVIEECCRYVCEDFYSLEMP